MLKKWLALCLVASVLLLFSQIAAHAQECDEDIDVHFMTHSSGDLFVKPGETIWIHLMLTFDSPCRVALGHINYNGYKSIPYPYRGEDIKIIYSDGLACDSSPCFKSYGIIVGRSVRPAMYRLRIVAGEAFGNLQNYVDFRVHVTNLKPRLSRMHR